MTRIPIAFASADISALARSLREQLTPLGETPSHVAVLNMLARAGGYRNFQHLKAAAEAAPVVVPAMPAPAPPPLRETVDEARVARVAGAFRAGGRAAALAEQDQPPGTVRVGAVGALPGARGDA